jgi:hypothetical protein
MTNRSRCFLVAIALGTIPSLGLAQSAVPAENRPDSPPIADRRAFINNYCTSCHNQRNPTAGLALDRLDPAVVGGHQDVWEKVVQKVRAGDMPPAGGPHPEGSRREGFAASLESALDQEALAHPNPGRAVAHRLNRTEYTNAIRDLLGIEIDGRELLPADDSGYGFDNIADVLSVSPSLLDRYMSAAGKISRTAVGDPALRPSVRTYSVRRDLLQNR